MRAPGVVSGALMHNIKHNQVLHDTNVILSVEIEPRPFVSRGERSQIERIGSHFLVVRLRFGFMDTPNVSQALGDLRREGLKFDIMHNSFYLGRRKLVPDPKSPMPAWQERLFIGLSTAAADPTDYFRLPANRVVELGAHVSV